jgi:hypothetical protein
MVPSLVCLLDISQDAHSLLSLSGVHVLGHGNGGYMAAKVACRNGKVKGKDYHMQTNLIQSDKG